MVSGLVLDFRRPTSASIFANDTSLATIIGSGTTAKTGSVVAVSVYYNATDLLNSSSIMTDSIGAIAETMDYYPFGGIRIDNKTGAFNEQRKYIGQEYDQDTGLNYLNARYYNATLARFISQDPMFWNFDSAWLVDPQNQNSYSYARNNPIIGSDPSGLIVELMSRPVFEIKGRDVGVHTFFKVTPDHPDQININGLPMGTKEFTFGAYHSGSNWWDNKLSKQIGTKESGSDNTYAFGDGKIINSTIITPPEGQNDTQFINNMGKEFNNINVSGVNYFWHGNIHGPGKIAGLYDGNSNNFAYTLGVKSGVQDQMNSFNPNPGNVALGGAPGYKNNLPNTTLYQQIQDSVNSIRNKISNFISSLQKNK